MSNSNYKSENDNNLNELLNEQMHELLEQNHNMLKDAQEGQWDKVIEAEVLRNTRMKNFYSTSGVAEMPDIQKATKELLSINREMEKLAIEAKQTTACEAQSINKGRNAINAYARNES